jgi:hypothetical protein
MGGDKLRKIGFQHLVAHPEAASWIEALFLEVKAVIAVQIAG